jgi:hypothetical protein
MSLRPDLGYMKYHLREAEELMRRNTWVPCAPAEILQLTRDPDARLVRNGADLLDVLEESLSRLESRLQGETPAAIDLWNDAAKGPAETTKKGKVFRPKNEPALSDYIKRHLDLDLRERGVIINREVEIRPPLGGAKGERTDVHVNVAAPTGEPGVSEKVTAIIEVKGCWNPELNDAMKTQLVQRYLKDNECRHGLYLIGWCMCDQWDAGDDRRGRTPGTTIAQARERFLQQAAALSTDGREIRAVVLNAALR